MAKSDDVQDEQYVKVPWQFLGIHAYNALVLQYISASMHLDGTVVMHIEV